MMIVASVCPPTWIRSHRSPAVVDVHAGVEGDGWADDAQVGQLSLNLWLALEGVDDALAEVGAVAAHVFPRQVVRDHWRVVVLVAQHVAAVVVGVDDVQDRFVAGDLANVLQPTTALRWDHRRVDEDVAVGGLDQADIAAAEIQVDVDARCDLLHG